VLAKGHQGVVFLALQNRVPVLIVAHYGGEKFWHNIKRLKRTWVTFVVGKPFLLVNETKITKNVRKEMTDQIMARLASMLPERYHGAYTDLEIISDKYIQYKIEPYSQSEEECS
jgi:1-acyl-sn-glycerol-3-phosphate acyltransferase